MAELGLGALLLLGAIAAAVFGGGRERAGAAMLIAVSAAFLLAPADPRQAGAVWVLVALDLAAVALFGRLSWKAPGAWPLWALAAQAVAAAASVAYGLQADVEAQTYRRVMMLTRYVAAAALLIGAFSQAKTRP